MAETKTASLSDKEIVEKFDKSSRTRTFTSVYGWIVSGALVAFVAYVLAYTLFFTPTRQFKLTTFLACIVFFSFLFYPASPRLKKRDNYVPWYDLLLGSVGAYCYLHFAFNVEAIVNRSTDITKFDFIVGIVGILLLFEACRRVTGIPIIVVCSAALLYALFGSGMSLRKLVFNVFYTTDGILGTPLSVCATFIILFIVFGAFLEKTGIGNFFVDLANSVVGGAAGGPAKVAVISSALMGMYSGSSVANTVGSGSITIPMMKKTGYRPDFAAAVEAAASTGGQIMPPIMGAAAFLMSEMTGKPYLSIVVCAILPALLYFTGIFLMVHLEAKKLGLDGLPKDAIPNFFKLLAKNWYLLLPIVILMVCMSYFTPAKSACISILAVIVVSMFSKSTRLTPKKFVSAVESGAKSTIGVAIACAVAGIICCVLTTTGLAMDLTNTLVSLGQNNLLLALFLTMLCCILLGMGVPTTANYVIMATTTAPILVALGVPTMAAHMFVFYFGIVADITPPVALAAYAGAAIAGSNPMKTGVQATKLAIGAFIIPYIFALSPNMLFIDSVWYEVVLIVVSSIIGMYGISMGLEGYTFAKVNPVFRIIAVAAGLCLIYPGWLTDLIGFVVIGGIVAYQYFVARKKKTA